jgi:hypothetical protein
MVQRRMVSVLFMLLLSVSAYSGDQEFSADSVLAHIRHLSVTIGPRPMGSQKEHVALDWAVGKMAGYGADSAIGMRFWKAPSKRNPLNTNSGSAVGVFRGATDSTIVIGGHIDSAGREVPGANDNASGAATVIELARLWSMRPRHYTMVFITFGGEESGLCGSRHFVEQYPDIDDVVLMISIDMTGVDDDIVTIFETDSDRAPVWLVQDAYRMDRDLQINRLKYPTHFCTLNNLAGGAGSDHEPFLNRGVAAIDFSVGINRSPIHTKQDVVEYIHKPMLTQCGQLVDGLLKKYQSQGIPGSRSDAYMLWRPLGFLVFIPASLFVVFNLVALCLGIGAFIYGRMRRLRIERAERVRFSGFKLFIMLPVIAVFVRSGGWLLTLVKGLRYPWYVHLDAYLWYTPIWLLAGVWIVLQMSRKWRFSTDPYVYAKRGLIFLFLYLIGFGLLSMRLALYPAAALILFGLAVFVRQPILKIVFAILTPLPMSRLVFSEAVPFAGRTMAQIGILLDAPWKSMLFQIAIIIILVIWYVPFIYTFSYAAVSVPRLKSVLKQFRRPLFGLGILVLILVYGGVLYALPAYNEMWRPFVHVYAKYDISKKESELVIVGNESLQNVSVKSDTLEEHLHGRFNRKELPIDFKAQWFHIDGKETVTPGDRDTLNVQWHITSDRAWYRVTLSLEADTLEIYDFQSDLEFTHVKDRVRISWFADPPDDLSIEARFSIHPEAQVIRKVTAVYPEMPVPIQVSLPLGNVRYRTIVTRTDTLFASEMSDITAR